NPDQHQFHHDHQVASVPLTRWGIDHQRDELATRRVALMEAASLAWGVLVSDVQVSGPACCNVVERGRPATVVMVIIYPAEWRRRFFPW
ncbi:hypothetical protein, partial [Levilactobacillus spicheri]